MSATENTTTTTRHLDDPAELAAFVAWQGTDADALAALLTDQAEPVADEDREPEIEEDYPEADEFDGENPYVDDFDRWDDDRWQNWAERGMGL